MLSRNYGKIYEDLTGTEDKPVLESMHTNLTKYFFAD